jgi:hypothetical protein
MYLLHAAPFEEHKNQEDNGNDAEDRARDDTEQAQAKKQKSETGKSVANKVSSSSPTPMQTALTPFPKNVDVSKILEAGRLGNLNNTSSVSKLQQQKSGDASLDFSKLKQHKKGADRLEGSSKL